MITLIINFEGVHLLYNETNEFISNFNLFYIGMTLSLMLLKI